jgi:hypothetical protein
MQADRDGEYNLRIHAERLLKASEQDLRQIHDEVRRICRNSALLPPEIHASSGAYPFDMKVQTLDRMRDGSITTQEIVLEKFRTKVVQDEIRKGLIVGVALGNHGIQLFMTRESLEYAAARDAMVMMVCRELLAALAEEVTGVTP